VKFVENRAQIGAIGALSKSYTVRMCNVYQQKNNSNRAQTYFWWHGNCL